MTKIATSTLDLIGRTPLLEPQRYNKQTQSLARILVKAEAFNPAGSVKDRIAKGMVEAAEKEGLLKEGSVIIEPTSGNTGIGLAAVACRKPCRPNAVNSCLLTAPKSYLRPVLQECRGLSTRPQNWQKKSPDPLFPASLPIP